MNKENIGCKRCGMCCMTADINWKEITPENEVQVLDQLKWFNLHRCDTNVISYPDGRKRVALRIPMFCRMLDQNKDGTFFCKDYTNRPQLCKNFGCLRMKQGTPKSVVEPASLPQG